MKQQQSSAGFTIIEVIIFLALSSVMIFAAINAVSGRTREVRYADAVRATESYIETRINRAINGSILDDSQSCVYNELTGDYETGPSNGTCIFLGYMFKLDKAMPGKIELLQVYGRNLNSNDTCFEDNVTSPLFCAEPEVTIVGSTLSPVETFDIPWGLEIVDSFRSPNEARAITMFGYLRNPKEQGVVPVMFYEGFEDQVDEPTAYQAGVNLTASRIGDEFSAAICLTDRSVDEDDRRVALIEMGRNERQP